MDVKENPMEESIKYHIPEEIPANERTAFHGAAAAAAKAGKKNFNFGGKTHPVTMKKDTATKIADQKEAVTMDQERMKTVKHNQAMTNLKRLDKKHSDKDHMDHMKVRKAVDNAGQTLNKHGAHSDQYKSAYNAAKKLSDKHAHKESTMTFREKLISVLEGDRKAHYKGATEPETMDDKLKGKGAKDMAKPAKDAISAKPTIDEPEIVKKDMAKMTANVKKSPMRKNDNAKGDSTIIAPGTPMKDPAKMQKEDFTQHPMNGTVSYTHLTLPTKRIV